MGEQKELTPKRRAEIKRIRLYLWLGVIFGLFGFACQWGAVKATDATLPEAIGLAITLLWCGGLAGWLAFYSLWHRRDVLKFRHVTEDAIGYANSFAELLKDTFDQIDRWEQLSDRQAETFNTLKAAIEETISSFDQSTSPKRGPGRPEITPDDARGWIDKADRAAAELLVKNKRRPTRDEIANEIGLSTSTLGRYEKAAGRKVTVNK